jgi:FHA domain-containing protein/zinc ribbon protein
MSAVCPAGHTSTAEDYCDVCGMPIDAPAVMPGQSPAPPEPPNHAAGAGFGPAALTGPTCPNCATVNLPDALFCENCGYDFTTGTMPRPLDPPAGAPAEGEAPDAGAAAAGGATAAPSGDGSAPPDAESFDWVAEVWIDPAWYQAQESPDPLPSPGLPTVVPLRGRSLLVGRTSHSRNIHPAIDCESDSGVSRRQAQLTTDGSRWWVEDLDSANGTFVAPASAPLPDNPIPVGAKQELAADDRVYLGAWTRLVIRPATDEERQTLG